jgi:hypothetical protein
MILIDVEAPVYAAVLFVEGPLVVPPPAVEVKVVFAAGAAV